MPYERTGYAPWSLTREAGVQSATVDGTIQVPQYIQPTLNTGFIDEDGNWKGTKADEEQFSQIGTEIAVPNGQAILAPGGDPNFLNMRGFRTLQFALKTTRAGTYNVLAVFGPDTNRFANLSPIASGEGIRIFDDQSISDENIINDNVNLDTANAYFVFTILSDRCVGQELMQLKITNSSGGDADITSAFRKLI